VVREYARDVPPVAADEESLYRAIINLVSNALEAMGSNGGRLGLRWSGPRRPPPSGRHDGARATSSSR
jgi:nitrogen-specific signal transduction histidine kinase